MTSYARCNNKSRPTQTLDRITTLLSIYISHFWTGNSPRMVRFRGFCNRGPSLFSFLTQCASSCSHFRLIREKSQLTFLSSSSFANNGPDYELLSTLDEMTEKQGASDEQIRSLVPASFSDVPSTLSMNHCTICLEQFTKKDTVKCLPCSHVYHDRCIDEWLSRKPNCPVCKQDTFN